MGRANPGVYSESIPAAISGSSSTAIVRIYSHSNPAADSSSIVESDLPSISRPTQRSILRRVHQPIVRSILGLILRLVLTCVRASNPASTSVSIMASAPASIPGSDLGAAFCSVFRELVCNQLLLLLTKGSCNSAYWL